MDIGLMGKIGKQKIFPFAQTLGCWHSHKPVTVVAFQSCLSIHFILLNFQHIVQ